MRPYVRRTEDDAALEPLFGDEALLWRRRSSLGLLLAVSRLLAAATRRFADVVDAVARGDGDGGDDKSTMVVVVSVLVAVHVNGDFKSMMVVLERFAGDLRRTGMELCAADDDGVFGVERGDMCL